MLMIFKNIFVAPEVHFKFDEDSTGYMFSQLKNNFKSFYYIIGDHDPKYDVNITKIMSPCFNRSLLYTEMFLLCVSTSMVLLG